MMLIWIAAVLILLAVILLIYLLKPHQEHAYPFYVRLHRNLRLFRRLKRIRQAASWHPAVTAFSESLALLADDIHLLNRRVAATPPLPSGADGEPRMMDTARDAADAAAVSGSELLAFLNGKHFSTSEILSFPVCVALAASHRLTAAFASLEADIRQTQQAMRIIKKLIRAPQPELLLEKRILNSYGLAEMLRLLKEQHRNDLLEMTCKWLQKQQFSADALTDSANARMNRYTDEIHHARTCFSGLQRLDWPDLCCTADETHSLLLGDPGSVYPRMDSRSQLQLRLDIGEISRATGLFPTELIRRAFIQCGSAENNSLENCVAYYFQAPQGLKTLFRSLPTRRGRIHSLVKGRTELLHYIASWFIACFTGFGFLQSGQPAFLLPFFLILTGFPLRRQRIIPSAALPGISITPGDPALRTLVMLHAQLADPQDVVSAVQRLRSVILALHGEQADFLLLGDFSPCITAVSGFDLSIMQAAAAAVSSLENSRVMYLHRGRCWDDMTHCYRARAGQRGAITEVCRLIASGECLDTLTHATVLPASLERKYAYLLTLDNDAKPAPGMLSRFLSIMAHPLCQPAPAQHGLRGHALLLPAECSAFDGTALIRPDAFLDAVDGLLYDAAPYHTLCGELAGQRPVSGAHLFSSRKPFSWQKQYAADLQTWRLVPWQFPIVSTPSGWLDNPLSYFRRVHLRRDLWNLFIPLSQAVLIHWGLIVGNLPLILFSLLIPEMDAPYRRPNDLLASLCRTSLLPTKAAVAFCALLQLARRKTDRPPDWTSIMAWVQGISAAWMAALVFVLPAGSSGAFILSALFACFPLAQRFLDQYPTNT